MASVAIRGLGKDAPPSAGKPGACILGDVSLDIADGEFLVLVGPSGCGKTTLLRCIAGLEAPDRGEIALDGAGVNHLGPAERDLAMVFQSYALYPHLTVRENLAFGLRMRRTPLDEIGRRVDEAARMLGIEPLLGRLPAQLSGGQRQRVAMGRAVVRRPKAFLFDEPLSNLDAALRGQMRVELKRLHGRLGATMIYVTHDQVEAMTLADRIVVLRAGAVEQVGTPRELYDRPANLFVARFIGTPEMNVIDDVGVRAEDIAFSGPGTRGPGPATVEVVENLGWESLVHVRVGERTVVARMESARAPSPGSTVELWFAEGKVHRFAPDGRRIA